MLLSSIASIIFQITYKTQNLVKCQGTLSIKTQSIWKVDRKIYQTKHLSIDPYANYNYPSSFNQSWSHEPDLFQPLPQNAGTSLESLINSLLINNL